MNKITIVAVLIAGFTLVAGSSATAQTQAPTTFFVDVNGGAQTQARTLETSTSFPLYGETAVINAAQSIDGGGLFDLSVGYRFRPTYGVAVGVSMFSNSGDGSLVGSIPSPIAINRPATVNGSATGVNHSEFGTHVMFVYFMPVLVNFDISVFAGPSFFKLNQDVLSGTVPTGTQSLTVASEKQKGNGTGVNAGVNFNYMFRPNYGAGVFVRYAGASVDLASADDVKVGGLQLGGGLRLRF